MAVARPVVLVGCGRLGSALVEGWLRFGPVTAADLIVLTRSDTPGARAARAAGARVNPEVGALKSAGTVVLAVKPGGWRDAVVPLVGRLADDAVLVSLMAGVRAVDLVEALDRPLVRVMPTTGVARGEGVAAIWAATLAGRAMGHALFARVAQVVDLDDEALMDAATATAGSAPAFLLSLVQALARAGTTHGLSEAAATALARGALRSAAAGIAGEESLEQLIDRVTSPGGTTRAGLDASADYIDAAAQAAIAAAIRRAGELG